MRLTSVASVKRGGGSVKCCDGLDALLGQRFACGHRRQAAGVLVLFVVAPLLIQREKAIEADDLAGRAKVETAVRRRSARISTLVRSSSALSIWLAIVRVQISS